MESHERQLLQKSIEPLARSIDFDKIAPLLLIRKTFNQSMIDHIKSYEDNVYRNMVLISDLQTRGPKAYREFIEILELSGSIEAMRIISPNSLIKQQPLHHHYDNHRPLSVRENPGRGYYSKMKHDPKTTTDLASSSSSSGKDEVDRLAPLMDEEPLLLHWHPYSSDTQSSSISSETSLELTHRTLVKHSIVCHDNSLRDYQMTSKPRGPCIIINNIEFNSDIFPQRKGSDVDATRLADVFYQLGFNIYHERNLSAKGMKKALKKIRSKLKSSYDALVVIILSHGSECGIYGTDGIELDFNDIIDLFDNRHCKIMIGKPKVFIVQACRGRLADYGRDDSSESSTSFDDHDHDHTESFGPSNNRPPPFTRVNEFTKDRVPTRTDMLFCFSCLPGYVSVRDEVAGSWLGVSLSYFLMTESWHKDLLQILTMVSGDIKQRISSEGNVEAVETTCLGWSKNLYFNPGIYR